MVFISPSFFEEVGMIIQRERTSCRNAFSIVELLVVIAIVGVVLGITIPAVQRVRENSRANSCRNNLVQLSKGILNSESADGRFVAGGWAGEWLGDSSRDAAGNQPGGWGFQVLPYIEEIVLWENAKNILATDAESKYRSLCKQMPRVFSCPSRRGSNSILYEGGGVQFYNLTNQQVRIERAGRSDYAANGGSSSLCPRVSVLQLNKANSNEKIRIAHRPGETECVELDIPINVAKKAYGGYRRDTLGGCDESTCQGVIDDIIFIPKTAEQGDWMVKQGIDGRAVLDGGIPDFQDGLVRRMRRMSTDEVLDGLSSTYMIGEKYVPPESYDKGNDKGDKYPPWSGYSVSNIRWGHDSPLRDQKGVKASNAFGSAHIGVFNMAFADGSVQAVTFDINPSLHKSRCSIFDAD